MIEDGITLVVPVYNEEDILEKNVLTLCQYCSDKNMPFEVVVVDNGSIDKTPEIGKRLSDQILSVSYYRILHKTVGGAFWKAVENAKYDKLVTIDADLSIDLDFIFKSYQLLNDFDVVVGTKFTGDQDRSFMRVFASKFYIILAKMFLNLPVSDFSIGAKAYRKKSVIKYLGKTSDWTGYVVELINFMNREAMRITEIPVNCIDKRKGRFNLLHEGFYRYSHLFRLILKNLCSKKDI